MSGMKESDLVVGNWIADHIGSVRVMAVVEGYMMVRRPYCMPFVVSVRDAMHRFEETDTYTGNQEQKS